MTGEMEPLEYRNRFVKTLVQDLEGYAEPMVPHTPQPILEGQNTVILNVTLDEWVKLLSAVFTGADFCYTDKSDTVRWILLRAVEQPMSICDMIIDCINNNPATRAAIVDALKSDPDFNEWFTENVYRITEGMIGGKLIGGDCDNSVVAGRALAIVNRLASNAEDALEIIEVGTNDEERIATIIGGIPVLGEAPVDEVVDILQDILEDFAENFSAANTTERREELARLIWCKMLKQPDCSITFQQLFEVLQEKAASGLTILSVIADVIGFLNDGDFDNDDALFYGFLAAQVAFVLNSKEFFGINVGKMSGIMRDALPSSIWEEWDPCVPEDDQWVIVGIEGYATGVINSQSSTDAEFTASANGDGLYRLVVERTDADCVEVVSITQGTVSPYPYWYDCSNTLHTSPVEAGDDLGRISYASNTPFSVSLTWTPAP